ncbi:hypothetical protein GXM_00437 [Nostoc sphaeroides CCNUC1]|uniref:Uncharacterized protein n=1 Tax=Nostoc sphaeroides CCNUC1 TaxID=2653204 RepID=A0A5P8VRP7_9NOSO|nr:hypothetical protein GXM_00437 [Nostoc sphaeroides CCNUC1]
MAGEKVAAFMTMAIFRFPFNCDMAWRRELSLSWELTLR